MIVVNNVVFTLCFLEHGDPESVGPTSWPIQLPLKPPLNPQPVGQSQKSEPLGSFICAFE